MMVHIFEHEPTMNQEKRQPDEIACHFEAERQLGEFVIYNQRWAKEAACADADPEEFYGSSQGDPRHLRERFCLGCPVRHDCLVESIINNDMDALVQGGLLVSERQELRKRYREQQGLKPRKQPRRQRDDSIVREVLAEHFRWRNELDQDKHKDDNTA
jgi:hypothetical protein